MPTVALIFTPSIRSLTMIVNFCMRLRLARRSYPTVKNRCIDVKFLAELWHGDTCVFSEFR